MEKDKKIERERKMRRKRKGREGERKERKKKERNSDTIRLIWRMNITDMGRLGQDLFFKPQKPRYQLTHQIGYNWEVNEEKLFEKSCHVNMIFISTLVNSPAFVWNIFPHWVLFHICHIYPPPSYLGICVYFSFINFDRKIGDFLPVR